MEKEKIIFKLNDLEKVVLELDAPLNEVHCCYYDATIVFIVGDKRYILSDNVIDSVRINIEYLQEKLSQALVDRLKLDKSLMPDGSIKKDLGYLYNEYRQRRSTISYEADEEGVWVGMKYLLWGSDFTAWIYNNDSGDIIFEVTPNFNCALQSVDENQPHNLETYEKWIKNYEPVFIRTIPKSIAYEWLSQANSLLATIKENVARSEKNCH